MKVYTKGGDKGRTSLIGGARVPKFDLRVDAYGTVDELTASVALLYDSMNEDARLIGKMAQQRVELLEAIERLMRLGAILAAEGDVLEKLPPLLPQDVEKLEAGIDAMTQNHAPSFVFTLPVGATLISKSHVARTICRRAERLTLKSAEVYPVPPVVISYLNRLSDYLYIISIEIARVLEIEPVVWQTK